jgi:hypothetical protein
MTFSNEIKPVKTLPATIKPFVILSPWANHKLFVFPTEVSILTRDFSAFDFPMTIGKSWETYGLQSRYMNSFYTGHNILLIGPDRLMCYVDNKALDTLTINFFNITHHGLLVYHKIPSNIKATIAQEASSFDHFIALLDVVTL